MRLLRFYSGYAGDGDLLNVFFQVKFGTFSLNDLINGIANAVGMSAVSIDFLPSFSDVTLTACTGRASNNDQETLSAQFGGIADHGGNEAWPSTGSSAVPMGSTHSVGAATLDFKTKIADGVYLNANFDFATGTSDFAQMTKSLVCFLPNILVGSCTTQWALEAFVPRDGNFDEAYFKMVQSAETYSSNQFITAIGERSLKVTGFGNGGVQSAEAEVCVNSQPCCCLLSLWKCNTSHTDAIPDTPTTQHSTLL